jgi:MtrB/PioB family decaheme-associated outer membrane protein
MRGLLLVHLVCCVGLIAPPAAHAQTTQPPAPAAKPPAQPQGKPAETDAATPEATESAGSLFDQTWHQFEFGGRATSVSGDPARFQRYQDLGSGVLFDAARYAREDPDGSWRFRAAADNVGWRDQRYFANYEKTGRFVVAGTWDQIPQFYSVDTATPYSRSADTMNLDDTTQRAIQNGQATLSAYIPAAATFDLRERRDVGNVSVKATPTPQIDLNATFTTNRHVGELPWGASFGFSNDVEVALPYDSRANDFTLGAEWTNGRNMLRVGYAGSWFDNLDDTLVWDNPLRLDDAATAPGHGRTALWPSNSAQTISVGGFSKFARRTQVTGALSFGFWNNDQPLLPFTINAALPQLALPRDTAQADAHVFSTTLNLVSRPRNDWRLSGKLRVYSYDNQTPHADIPQFINYDTSVAASPTGGPELYAHSQTNFDADATWTGLSPLAVSAGYSHNGTSHDFRIFESTGEDVLRLTADTVGSQWVTFRAQYELSDRSGSGLDEALLAQIGEQPAMRHYDVANRSRNRFTGTVDVTPNELWTLSASAGIGNDDYDASYFGLQESSFQQFTLAADYQHTTGFNAGATYTYENYDGLQRSRSASPGQENDPNRDWTADAGETVHYFSIYAATPSLRGRTEARISYDYSHAEGRYLYTVVPGGPLPAPSQLPNVFNKLQQLHLDIRHKFTNQLAGTLSYLYEPFRVYDFAFDQSVVNSIVQPSSLVLGYVYRPYTAHSVVFGIRYLF